MTHLDSLIGKPKHILLLFETNYFQNISTSVFIDVKILTMVAWYKKENLNGKEKEKTVST